MKNSANEWCSLIQSLIIPYFCSSVIVHNSIVGAGWGSQASFSERLTMQEGHISLGEGEFPNKVESMGKGPAFAVLKILLTSV